MPIKSDRQYRSAVEFVPGNDEYIVEGYATTFNDPYVMYSYEGVDYKESIDRRALDGADMTDVIMQYDHQGKVYARMSNGTLTLTPDERGLKIRADLSKSAGARSLYEEIKEGLITKMSWAFTIDEEEYDRVNHERKIMRIKKVYDVSAVSIPANPGTDISARSYFDGEIEKEKQELLAAQARADKIAKIKLMLEV